MVAAASTMTPIAQTIYIIPTAMELFFARFHFTAARYMALKTYVMWVDCSGLNMSDAELEKFWRDDCKLILSHGSEFGTGYSQYRRFNVACSKLKLEEILERILKQMQKNKLI